MQKVLLVSKLLKVKQDKFLFHFIGYFKGERVTKVIVSAGDYKFEKTYVLTLDDYYIKNGSLFGKVISSRVLD